MPFTARSSSRLASPHPHSLPWSAALIMGILNVTPDSFSDGGHFYAPEHAPERALEQARKMLDEAADIIDIGGESTRPNATPLTPGEEQSRILPVIESLLQQRPETVLSVDTFHASTARHAIEAGAEIVNDVSGHLWAPDMSTTCAQLGCGAILMHTRGRPQDWPSLPPLAANEVLPLVRHRTRTAPRSGHDRRHPTQQDRPRPRLRLRQAPRRELPTAGPPRRAPPVQPAHSHRHLPQALPGPHSRPTPFAVGSFSTAAPHPWNTVSTRPPPPT